MTQTTSIQRNLMSLAILKVNWAGERDYVENFIPFIAQALYLSKQSEISLPEIQSILEKEFGLTIPQGPLKTILKRANRKGYLSVSKGIYTRNDAALEGMDFVTMQQAVERQHNTLIDKLISYCNANHGETWTPDEAEVAMQEYLDCEGFRVISLGRQAVIPTDSHSNAKKDFIIASFINYLHERDAAGFEYLVTVVKGGMLADAVYFPEIGSIKPSFRNLDVYFDTNFLLRAMGFAPKAKQDSCLELLDLLYELSANLKCFTHTFEEIRGVLFAAASCLRNNGKGVTGTFETYEHFVAQGCNAGDVDLIVAKLPKLLSSLRVKIVETPSHSESLTIDETAFERLLLTKYNFVKDESRYKDVRSITAVYRLRNGQKSYDIDSCKAIFVTTNTDLAKATIEFFNVANNGEISLCLPDYVFATHAWLKKPTSAPDLPRKQLIADCYAALNPTNELWMRFLREIERLQQSKIVTAEDYALLRYSSVARTALMNATCGDPEVFVEGTIQEVLDKAKATIRADLEADVAAMKLLQSEANQRAEVANKRFETHRERIRSRSVCIGRYVARFVGVLMVILLFVGLFFTFPGVSNRFSISLVMFALLILFTGVIFLNLYCGTSVKYFMRKIERWVSEKCQALML